MSTASPASVAIESPFALKKGNGSIETVSAVDIQIEPELRQDRLAEINRHEAVTLRWRNIHATIPAQKRYLFGLVTRPDEKAPKKEILTNVNGVAHAGKLLALMGASGSGKTTLLNILNGRSHSPVKVEGAIYVNNRKIGKSIANISAYVQQVDMFIATLTVHEHLTFQSHLRMDAHLTKQERAERVTQVILELGLLGCQETLVGSPSQGRGISGGELKRLSLAAEVLTDPPLLFCDEPTSGLDVFMAQNVFTVLKQMASRGKTVIATVHQPSSDIFAMFDQLLLMSQQRVAYLGAANEAERFFADQGFPCPVHYNPADHFIQVLAIHPGDEQNGVVRSTAICDAFQVVSKQEDWHAERQGKASITLDGMESSVYKAGFWVQMAVVFWRTSLAMSREPQLVKSRMMQSLFLGILLGMIFYQQQMTQEGVSNINGAIYLFISNLTIIGMFAVVLMFTAEMPIFLREHSNRMYRVDVYFLCKTLVDLPAFFLLPLLFTVIAYWMVGMYADASTFFICCGISILVTNAAVSFGYLVSCACGSAVLSIAVAPVFNAVFIIFGGYFLNAATVPKYWIWVEYISWYKYGNEALVINQWQHVANISCPLDRTDCVRTGLEVIERFNFRSHSLAFHAGMLIVLVFGYRLLAFVALFIRARRKT